MICCGASYFRLELVFNFRAPGTVTLACKTVCLGGRHAKFIKQIQGALDIQIQWPLRAISSPYQGLMRKKQRISECLSTIRTQQSC